MSVMKPVSLEMNFKPETDHALFDSLRTLRSQRDDGTLAHSAYENEVTKLLAQRIYNASPPPPALYPHAREAIPQKIYFCWDSQVHRVKALTFPGTLPYGNRMMFQCKTSAEALHMCRPGMLDSLLAAHCNFPSFSPAMDVLPKSRPVERPSFALCNSCGKQAGLLCSKCKIVCYCSFACQKKDWSEHKQKCECLLRGKRLDELIAADLPAVASDKPSEAAPAEVVPPAKNDVHGYRLLQTPSGTFIHVVYSVRGSMQQALTEYAKLLLEPVVQQSSGSKSSNKQPSWSLMCCTHDIPGFAPGAATKFCEGVAEVLSMPYYTLTAHQLSPSVVSALLNMLCIPASAVALYLLRSFLRYSQESNPEISSKSIQEKLPLWSKTYDLPLELLTDVWALHFNSSASAGSNDALLQEVMSLAVAAVDLQAARLSSLFTSQELRCLTGLLPVGTIHYHQNMVPSNSHVLALIEPSDLAAFEVAFKAHQAEDRPAGVLGSSPAAPADSELAETVASAIGVHGVPLPQSPSSAGFVYRDHCHSSLTFARHVMFQQDIADAVNGVSFSFRPSHRGRGLGAEMFSEVPESDDVPGAFELRGSEVKAAMKQVADCLAALEPKKPQAQ